MDFEGNLSRIRASISKAKALGAKYRVGPELEVSGYGCEDHFFEMDTNDHAFESLHELLKGQDTYGILCDIGMPVIHRGVLYNCRVFCLDGKILLIRPKLAMANDGNYREARYFSAWKHAKVLEDHILPSFLGQPSCPFGDGILQLNDATLGCETCEELFTPRAPHIDLSLAGVDIISNGSGSHHQLRKLNQRLDLIRGATSKAGGVYLYANQRGCDGGRLYFDGCSCIAVNGGLVAQGGQFGLSDVEVIAATVDLDQVASYRNSMVSLREQASSSTPYPSVRVHFSLARDPDTTLLSRTIEPKIPLPAEEIGYGPACWLWDYLRRSGASGYLLPLSGGADSACTAAIVGCMCQLVAEAVNSGDADIFEEAKRVGRYSEVDAVQMRGHMDPREFAHRIFSTIYMGTLSASSKATRQRSKTLSSQIGSHHTDLNIDMVVESLVALFQRVTGKRPAFRVDGGNAGENLALQNIQARVRMVVAFLFAQLTPWVRGRDGFLLVLGSANVDEGLRGYLTKYDCSSADINPIGGISKQDIRMFLKWAAEHLKYPELAEVEAAPPSAELEPLREGEKPQIDEDDMGMSYDELSVFGRLRKISRYGPVSMLRACLQLWQGLHTPLAIATKVKAFFRFYAINRHKMTTITPSYHAENYSPDDNRFDHRQFLYRVSWPWQFKKMDEISSKASGAVGNE